MYNSYPIPHRQDTKISQIIPSVRSKVLKWQCPIFQEHRRSRRSSQIRTPLLPASSIYYKNKEYLINSHFHQRFQLLRQHYLLIIIIILDKNSMISKYSKNIIGIEKKIRPFYLKSSNIDYKLIIYKGYQPHYQWFLEHKDEFTDKDSFYCYDRCSIDLALEMALKNTNRISYISTRNYQSVKLVSKNPLQNSINFSQSIEANQYPSQNYINSGRQQRKPIINKLISDTAKKIMKDYQFVICNSYLDIHPLQAYQKICGYLMIKPDEKILQVFEGFKVCNQQLFKSFMILPVLKNLRKKYLVEEQLKVQKLERKEIEITKEDIQSTICQWKQIVQINSFIQSHSNFDQKQKLHWIIHNKLGQQISKKQILNQKHLRYSYATWT